MPPGSTKPDNNNDNNMQNLNNILSQDEIDYLLSHFEIHRKSLRCPNCEKKGIFRRNGSNKSEPPQPIFRCNGCGSSFRAKTTLNIVNSIQPTPANTQTSMNPEFSGSFQDATSSQVAQTVNGQTDSQPFLNMIQLITKELASARTEIERLRNTATALLQSTLWHQTEKLQQIKDQSTAQRQQRRQEAAARLLQPPSTNQGFKYIYLPTKARVPIGQICSRLRKLDIDSNRIIDIHYPDHNIVALLIHNDYEDELRQQLQRFKVIIKKDFNPCDPQLLRDPKYADRTPAEREDLAFMHHFHYVDDISRCMESAVPQKKIQLGRLKTSFTVNEELRGIIAAIQSDQGDMPTVNATANYGAQTIIIGSSNNISCSNVLPKRQLEGIQESAEICESKKRQRKHVIHDGYINSDIISDDSYDPTSILSESSYVVSEVDDAPCGYICKMGMHELDSSDIPSSPIEMADSQLAALVVDAQSLASSNSMHLLDVVNRLRLSVIFESNEEQADTIADLLNSVYQNIREFKRAILTKRFYNQPEPSSNFVDLSLNNILSSTYFLHGMNRIKDKGSELNLIATSVYKQREFVDEDKLRPDILIHARQHGQVIEVACGEVKKPGVSQQHLNEDKIRVLEVMKRQLHIRLKYAKAHYEAVIFGILVQGFSVVLIQMTLDLTKGVYVYQEQPPFLLPTTFETYSHMDTSIEFMQAFKV
ncbi:hypothetical protein G6F54_004767 [Rhizopus delemar]|nr:hypothetical protein G6F54_004767 [Rhizopus delemar]